MGGYCCTSNLDRAINGPGNGNCPANLIAAIPKTIQGYACVNPRTEKIWHGTGSRNDSVAVINADVTATDDATIVDTACCSWHDIANLFDAEDGIIPTFAHYGPDENHPDHPNCNCQREDRYLTITLRKESYIRSIKLTPRTSLIDGTEQPSYVNIFLEYKEQVHKIRSSHVYLGIDYVAV